MSQELILALILVARVSEAVTISPASCDVATVQAALTTASNATGDVIVQLPACTQAWASALTVNLGAGFANVTSLTLRGAGTAPVIGSAGQTLISKASAPAFDITTAPGKPLRISNLTLSNQAQISISGTGRPGNAGAWRVDHVSFTAFTERTVWIDSYTYGLIDHSQLVTTYSVIVGLRDTGGGNGSWSRPPTFGTAEAVYVEDNTLEYKIGRAHV